MTSATNKTYFKRYEDLEFTDDFMFGQVLRNRLDLCKLLLEAILDAEISEIVYSDTQKVLDTGIATKGVRLDVLLKNSTTVFNVEMQTSKAPALGKRSRFYQSQLDMDDLQKGDLYEDLKECYIIFLCTTDPFDRGRSIYRFETLCKDENDLALGDEAYKIFVNSNGKDQVNETLAELFAYMNHPKHHTPKSKLVDLIAQGVERAKKDAEGRAKFMKLTAMLHDERAAGIALGEAKIITNMFHNQMSIEQIAACVGESTDRIREILASVGVITNE